MRYREIIEGRISYKIRLDAGLAKRLPEANTKVFMTKDGREIEMSNSGSEVEAKVDGKTAGTLYIRNRDDISNQSFEGTDKEWHAYLRKNMRSRFYTHRAWVEEEFRGQGVATAMYDYAYLAGFRPMEPSSSQTDGGAGVWRKRRGQVGRMTNWQLSESLFDMNTPENDPEEVFDFKGLRFEKQKVRFPIGSFWFVFVDQTPIGAFAIDERAYNGISLHTEVAEPYQRKGYGRIIYDFAKGWGEKQGKKLWPNSLQSDAGKSFWKKNSDLFTESADPQGPKTLIDVAEHFLFMHDDLLDDDEEIDDLDQATALAIIRRNYISGTCGAFAVALHDLHGYPIVGINGGMHVAVQAPDGSIIDFDGRNPLLAVLKRYGMGKNTPVRVRSREDVVDDVLMGEEESNDPWDEIAVARFVMNKLARWN